MNIIFLGPQSSGKGTQAELLSKKLDTPVITTGDILRNKRAVDDEEGRLITSYINKGKFVPDDLINSIVRKELVKYKKGIILDGYPRSIDQAEELGKFFNVDKVIFLDVPDAVVLKRMTSRRICKQCGAIYNLNTNPPQKENTCDKCSDELIQRHDDTNAVIAVRLNIYHKLTEPLVEYYKKQGKLIRIDGAKTIKEVYEEIKRELKV